MIRKSKWIEDTSPEQPLSEAARLAVQSRLEMVWDYLSQVGKPDGQDPETVHQLRVWSRRSMAALQSFEELLPPRRAMWMKKQLRRLRRTAGEARDLDVLSARLHEELADQDGKNVVLDAVDSNRRTARKPLGELYERLAKKGFERRVAKLVDRIRYKGPAPEPSFGDAARSRLSQALGEFVAAAGEDFADISALHQFRITGKRLRYSMELFAGAFDAGFREEPYEMIEQLQEKLGRINDHAAAADRFETWLEKADDGLVRPLRKLLAGEKAALRRERRKFFAWWNPERAAAFQAELAAYLTVPVGEEAG